VIFITHTTIFFTATLLVLGTHAFNLWRFVKALMAGTNPAAQ
jgi:hypothetical protein